MLFFSPSREYKLLRYLSYGYTVLNPADREVKAPAYIDSVPTPTPRPSLWTKATENIRSLPLSFPPPTAPASSSQWTAVQLTCVAWPDAHSRVGLGFSFYHSCLRSGQFNFQNVFWMCPVLSISAMDFRSPCSPSWTSAIPSEESPIPVLPSKEQTEPAVTKPKSGSLFCCATSNNRLNSSYNKMLPFPLPTRTCVIWFFSSHSAPPSPSSKTPARLSFVPATLAFFLFHENPKLIPILKSLLCIWIFRWAGRPNQFILRLTVTCSRRLPLIGLSSVPPDLLPHCPIFCVTLISASLSLLICLSTYCLFPDRR